MKYLAALAAVLLVLAVVVTFALSGLPSPTPAAQEQLPLCGVTQAQRCTPWIR